jgi:alkylhydroperoxidase family enzyme
VLPKLTGAAPRSPQEAAALAFAERLAGDPAGLDDAFMTELRAAFTDAEVVELGLVTAAFVMLGRLHRAFGVAPMPPGAHDVLADAGG